MKLRNKKTGEIEDLIEIIRLDDVSNEFYLRLSDNEGRTFKVGFNSLAELNEEWEDAPEEPKEYWRIDCDGEIVNDEYEGKSFDKDCKKIGNYFETKEEAELALRKLKAWKRLKDKGYRVMMNNHVDGMLYLRIWNDTTDAPTPINKAGEIYADLHLLFGGGE